MGLFKRKKYVTKKELDDILTSSFASAVRDISNLESNMNTLDEKLSNLNKVDTFLKVRTDNIRHSIGSTIECLESVLTKRQLSKKIEINGRKITIKEFLGNAIIALN